MIRVSEVVEPTEALEKILALIADAEENSGDVTELLLRVAEAANRGLIGEEDWPYVTKSERQSATFLKEQEEEGLDGDQVYRRKYAKSKPPPWYAATPTNHPHAGKR